LQSRDCQVFLDNPDQTAWAAKNAKVAKRAKNFALFATFAFFAAHQLHIQTARNVPGIGSGDDFAKALPLWPASPERRYKYEGLEIVISRPSYDDPFGASISSVLSH
jgi:hypothetical protein